MSAMKTWAAMYGLIWLSVIQILVGLYSPFGEGLLTYGIHIPLGIAVFGLAYFIRGRVKATACPDRIKRITKTTLNQSILQGVLGAILAAGFSMGWDSLILDVVILVHAANGLAIITQASSSATAYDMWEEKEFQLAPPLQA